MAPVSQSIKYFLGLLEFRLSKLVYKFDNDDENIKTFDKQIAYFGGNLKTNNSIGINMPPPPIPPNDDITPNIIIQIEPRISDQSIGNKDFGTKEREDINKVILVVYFQLKKTQLCNLLMILLLFQLIC
jgi:hypothetical protein